MKKALDNLLSSLDTREYPSHLSSVDLVSLINQYFQAFNEHSYDKIHLSVYITLKHIFSTLHV